MYDPYAPNPTIAAMAFVNGLLDREPVPGEDDVYADYGATDPDLTFENVSEAIDYLFMIGDIESITDDSETSQYFSYARVEYLHKLKALGLVELRAVPGTEGDAESGPRMPDLYWAWTPASGYDGRSGVPTSR